jgi:hypothetical protein
MNSSIPSGVSRARHIPIRYYWLKERIVNKEINITHIPTEDMLADLLTKPLQGSTFHRLSSAVRGST